MSSGSSATWSSLLEDKQNEVRARIGQGCRIPGTPYDDRSFRSAFEGLCKRQKEKKVPPLEAKLLPSYGKIHALVKAVDGYASDLANRPRNDTLESLAWWISFAAIEVKRYLPLLNSADRSTARMQSWSKARIPDNIVREAERQSTKIHYSSWTIPKSKAGSEAFTGSVRPFH